MNMARGSPALVSPLPIPQFEKVEDDSSTQPCGLHDLQARSYGFNPPNPDFNRPESYIRHIEPLESELARQVEYDMDEQDKAWLDAVNAERKKEQVDVVSYETFEVIMDRLEKEWFDLTKHIPKSDFALPSEDSTCAICDDPEGENSNAIVFCDGCNLAVHQDCYGVPYIPEGQWLCRKCTVSPENPVECILCPNEGGAFKQTVHGDWVHLLCAIWVPETRVANDVFMEPITGVEKISKQRWKLKCSVCEIREGACIQCAKTSCFLAFHTTCARREKLLLPMKSAHGSEPVTLTCYCDKHLPKEQQDIRLAALAADAPASSPSRNVNSKLSKSARAYAKTYKPGPPLVPHVIVERIMAYIKKVMMRKKEFFVHMLCRYWSLKREARRGAPLLKRLHLEPWTASAGGKMVSEEERRMRLELLYRLRHDLERVKEIIYETGRRERRKQMQVKVIRSVLAAGFFSHEPQLRAAFERIVSKDKNHIFRDPVSKTEVPDYYDVIKNPMSWSVIDAKLENHEYWSLQAFKDHINLVLDNAILYNKPGTKFHQVAVRIQAAAKTELDALNVLALSHLGSAEDLQRTTKSVVEVESNGGLIDDRGRRPAITEEVDGDRGSSEPRAQTQQIIGDLEPPLEVLSLLVSADAIQDDMRLIVDNPLQSLLSFEWGKGKPLPPPPPPPPPRTKQSKGKPAKVKRDRKAENERRKREKEEAAAAAAAATTQPDQVKGEGEHGAQVSVQIDFVVGGPRTRRAVAAAAEAQAEMPPPGDVAVAAADAVPKRGPSTAKRRMSNVHGEDPPLVDDVGSQESFKMFHEGWVLSSGQRRKGKPPPLENEVVASRPKKKAKTDATRGTSTLSLFSTTAEDNQTLRPVSTAKQEELQVEGESMELEVAVQDSVPEMGELDEAMEVDVVDEAEVDASLMKPSSDIAPSPSIAMPLEDNDMIPPDNVIKEENGKIIVEKLDSPAIRKQRAQRRKKEKRLAEAAARQALPKSNAVLNLDLQGSGAGPSRLSDQGGPSGEMDVEVGAGSELSELSEMAGEEIQSRAPRRKAPGRTRVQPSRASRSRADLVQEPGAITLQEGKMLEGGTLVWAKASTYPWWPAVIFEDDDLQIPPNILQLCQAERQKSNELIHILQFFDKSKSWQYLGLDKLRMLGENNALDDDLVATKSQRQKWKSNSSREDCRQAYRNARAEMETAESEGGNE